MRLLGLLFIVVQILRVLKLRGFQADDIYSVNDGGRKITFGKGTQLLVQSSKK